jgi:peptidoglycan/xylan/chitin deacetylase (PgdA/CDA1 family)
MHFAHGGSKRVSSSEYNFSTNLTQKSVSQDFKQYFCEVKSATVPFFIRIFFPSLVWHMPRGSRRIYLTFDDGPHPDITPKVLSILEKFNAKATFFCVGQNVERFPETYQMIPDAGHETGNHSFNHLKGWNETTRSYVDNVMKGQPLIQSEFFRPPYGRITSSQIRMLKPKFRIVMWSVLSYDFDKNTSPEQCLKNVTDHVKDGDIVVFHDSEKAAKNMLSALPKLLEILSAKGFTFPTLNG